MGEFNLTRLIVRTNKPLLKLYKLTIRINDPTTSNLEKVQFNYKRNVGSLLRLYIFCLKTNQETSFERILKYPFTRTQAKRLD